MSHYSSRQHLGKSIQEVFLATIMEARRKLECDLENDNKR